MISMACVFTIVFVSKLVSVEVACLLGVQNEIQAVCGKAIHPKLFKKMHLNTLAYTMRMLPCTLGVSPSLVTRWREGYSFWSGWAPYV